MRQATLIALGIVAAAVVVMLFLTSNGKASRTTTNGLDASHRPDTTKTTPPLPAPPVGAHRASATTDVPPRPGRVVRPSSRDRRPGESDTDYNMRLLFLDEYESFVRDAKLTQSQQERMLAALADMQEQAVLTYEEIWQADIDVEARGGDLKEQILSSPGRHAFIALRDELLARARDFLDPQQYERLKGGMLASSNFAYLAQTIEFFEISDGDE